jgi:hypothetical protein
VAKKAKQAGKITIRIISEPKILYVQRGDIAGSYDRVHVDVCTTCAAVVFDSVVHDVWHVSIEKAGD